MAAEHHEGLKKYIFFIVMKTDKFNDFFYWVIYFYPVDKQPLSIETIKSTTQTSLTNILACDGCCV